MLFDSTLRRELARGFGATLVVVLTIVLTMFLIRTVGQAADGAVAPQDVALLLGYVALGNLPTMMAMSMFVAIVVTLGRMYRDSEMAIWFSSGAGISRFLRPVLRVGMPVVAVLGLLLLVAWPWGNRNSNELRDRYQKRSDLSRVAPGVFQTSADGRRVFFIERESPDGVQARNVFILARLPHGEAVTTARTGHLETDGSQRFLVLDRGQRNEVDASSGERSLSSFERYRLLTSDNAAASAEAQPPKATDTLTLLRSREPADRAELTWRFGLLLGAANLLLLGVGLAATHPRRASNWNLVFALLTFLVYYNLINLSQAWVASGRVSMAGALLGLHVGATALALALLWWRDHAAVMRRPWHASPAARPGA
ncbi:MAG: LPS export ABC transporter permease LptF [Burkholderiales bacterium]|nr:LPS export ABC transporter permease LptF [Burkholderiales bacterium]